MSRRFDRVGLEAVRRERSVNLPVTPCVIVEGKGQGSKDHLRRHDYTTDAAASAATTTQLTPPRHVYGRGGVRAVQRAPEKAYTEFVGRVGIGTVQRAPEKVDGCVYVSASGKGKCFHEDNTARVYERPRARL